MPDLYRKAAGLLKKGEIVVYPTDTVYGLGTDATSKSAVEKINRLKRRPASLPLSVMVADHKMLFKYAKTNQMQKNMISGLLPGPYTLILEPKKKLPVSPGTVGFRIPDHECVKLARYLGKPVTSTSANIHGKPTHAWIGEIKRIFKKEVALYIDAGKLAGHPSRVFDMVRWRIARP